MNLPENSIVTARSCGIDSLKEFACRRIGYSVDGSGVNWKMDLCSKECFMHSIIAATATGTDRMVDRLTGCEIA